ncbi:MAG: phosphomannomutase/phosphoglucomutase [Minisyncoccia bacterium]
MRKKIDFNTFDPIIFHAYDIRGIYPEQINPTITYKIAQAFAKFTNPQTVVLGRDVRTSGPVLFEAVKNGLIDHGIDVIDIGVITSDMLYFAVANYGYDGGIIVSASHNPKEFNGLKLVRQNAVPVSGDNGIYDIRDIVRTGYEYNSLVKGSIFIKDIFNDYLDKCVSFVDLGKIRPLKVLANGMNGIAVQNILKAKLPVEIIALNETPNGDFPKGAPDPLLKENREETEAMIKREKVDIGAAWDADADRFFIFDETGRFIPPYYLSAFLSEYFCKKNPGAVIVHDLRLKWAIEDKVKAAGGKTVSIKAGRAYFNPEMLMQGAVFASETSGHYYFKDFYSTDNGLVPFLLVLQIVSERGLKVSELFNEYFLKYPVSGEINFNLPSRELTLPILEKIKEKYFDAKIDNIDGISIEYSDWRANIRGSNTEPLLRLNLEAISQDVVEQKTKELLELIKTQN